MAELQERLLADLYQFSVSRHARWDPLVLLAVREALRERLGRWGYWRSITSAAAGMQAST